MATTKLHSLRRHLRANAVAYVAVFIALGGTSYAAGLPRGSVGAKQLQVNAVTSPKVRDGSLRASDFASWQLPAGPRGAAGATGPQGPAGPEGAPGPSFGQTSEPSTIIYTDCFREVADAMQVSVSRRARILVAADGSWRSSAGGTRAVILALRDAQGKTLGEVETFGGLAAGSANNVLPISVAGVLNDKAGVPVVLEPGTYTLEMILATYAGSCGSEVELLAPHLTYALLGTSA